MYHMALYGIVGMGSWAVLRRFHPGKESGLAPLMLCVIAHTMARGVYAPQGRTVAELIPSGVLFGLVWAAIALGVYMLWLRFSKRPA